MLHACVSLKQKVNKSVDTWFMKCISSFHFCPFLQDLIYSLMCLLSEWGSAIFDAYFSWTSTLRVKLFFLLFLSSVCTHKHQLPITHCHMKFLQLLISLSALVIPQWKTFFSGVTFITLLITMNIDKKKNQRNYLFEK